MTINSVVRPPRLLRGVSLGLSKRKEKENINDIFTQLPPGFDELRKPPFYPPMKIITRGKIGIDRNRFFLFENLTAFKLLYRQPEGVFFAMAVQFFPLPEEPSDELIPCAFLLSWRRTEGRNYILEGGWCFNDNSRINIQPINAVALNIVEIRYGRYLRDDFQRCLLKTDPIPLERFEGLSLPIFTRGMKLPPILAHNFPDVQKFLTLLTTVQ